ncbi:unnamed protein product [Larinioides sclopetarius]|uniref:Adult-specific rigid cuticular protein 15.7 n=1 Tax=Larinioides sclopetarius TaxID=280406 RepID=A0AAV2BB79_9ARAC
MPTKRKGANLSRDTNKSRSIRNRRAQRTEEQVQVENTGARVRMAQLRQEQLDDTRAERNEIMRLEQGQSRRITVNRRRENDQQRQQAHRAFVAKSFLRLAFQYEPDIEYYAHSKVITILFAALAATQASVLLGHGGLVSTGVSNRAQTQDAFGNYAFNYGIKDGLGATNSRAEVGDAHGNKKGTYTIADIDGRARRVDYVADGHGFRATVKTNEPGTAASAPAAALIASPYAGPVAPVVNHVAPAAAVVGHAAAPVAYGGIIGNGAALGLGHGLGVAGPLGYGVGLGHGLGVAGPLGYGVGLGHGIGVAGPLGYGLGLNKGLLH